MKRSRRGFLMMASILLFLSGCAIRHDMAREAPAGWCPRRPQSAEYRFSPAYVDRSRGPEVTWYGHPSPEDQESNAAWCETLGPPTVIPVPNPDVLSLPADTVNVVAWNAWVGGGNLRAFLRSELGLTCSEGAPVPQAGFQPFVLLLQEVHQRSSLVPTVPQGAPVPWRTGPPDRPSAADDVIDVA